MSENIEGHQLFSLVLGPEANRGPATASLPNDDPKPGVQHGVKLDMRLHTCIHGKLSETGDFASLIIFTLDCKAEASHDATLRSIDVCLKFNGEIPDKRDVIEIIETGEDRNFVRKVEDNKRGVSWTTLLPCSKSHFGVLLRRNFNDLFVGNFTFMPVVRSTGQHKDSPLPNWIAELETVLFDPSAAAVGHDNIDSNNLQETGGLYFQRLFEFLSPSTSGIGLSQNQSNIQTGQATPSINANSTLSQDRTKSKGLMYHHKHRHVHTPNPSIHPSRHTPNHSIPMQHLHPSETDEEPWTEPTRYITSHEMGLNVFNLQITRSGVRCIRSIKMKITRTNDTSGAAEQYEAAGHWSMMGMLLHKRAYHAELSGETTDRYIVVGRMSTSGYVIKEKIFRYKEHDEEEMLRRLHKAVMGVRGMRDLFSLKSVSGFSLYQCDPTAGHHTRAILTPTQRATLSTFYTSYLHRSHSAPEFLWDDWIHRHLNASSTDPMHGRYSIEILLSWSVWRLALATSVPVILSLVVGLWYQTKKPEEGVAGDPAGTAWIIATYIITAGALIIAFLGVATGLEQA